MKNNGDLFTIAIMLLFVICLLDTPVIAFFVALAFIVGMKGRK